MCTIQPLENGCHRWNYYSKWSFLLGRVAIKCLDCFFQGVIDVLIVPFLILSCCMCCIACGVAMCCTDCCKCVPHIFDVEDTTTSDATRNGDEASRMHPESSSPTRRSQRYDVSVKSEPEPSKSKKCINVLAWILWVLSPFLGTLYIVTSLYRFDAIRTRNIDLYNPALAFFVIALFNLMVYFQQFVNSLCGYGHDKVKAESK